MSPPTVPPPGPPQTTAPDDRARLPELLAGLRAIVGAAHVLDDPADLLGYEYDATIERALPDAVVLPADTDQVAAVVGLAYRLRIPLLPRGSGTGLAGGAVPVRGGLVVVLTRMNRIIEIDAVARTALVQAGVVNLHLQTAAERVGLRYAPDPSSQRICTLGGNVATNAGGPHTLAHGSTVNHVLELEVVLPDGRVTSLGAPVVDAPGPDLRGLIVGSEGTLGIVTALRVALQPLPEAVQTLLAIFDDVEDATEAASAIIRHGIIPVALEMLDREIIRAIEPQLHVGYPLDAGAILLIEVEGPPREVAAEAATIAAHCREIGAREVRTATDEAERARLWEGRKGGVGAIGRITPNFYILDGVVPRTRLPEVMRAVYRLSEEHGFRCANIFHAGDGNLHPNILFDELEPGAPARVLELGGAIMRACLDAGGSITGEHGVGLEKRSYMSWIFDEPSLDAMERVRLAFGDPTLFNPCKVLPSGHGCGHAAEATVRKYIEATGDPS